MRKRITITIRDDIISYIDKIVDGNNIRSRSHAIENLLNKIISENNINNCLILAGGVREEFPNKENRCMLLLKGKPILEHVIKRLESFNIKNYIIYSDYRNEEIEQYFKNGHKFGVNIDYIFEEKPSGTIKPLLLVRKKIKDTFLMVYGDTISSIDINDFYSFHKSSGKIATMALTTVSNPKDYGVVEIKGNKITNFVEKPTQSLGSYLVSAGIFIFEPRIFNYISSRMQSVEKDLIPSLIKKDAINGYTFQGMWININSPKDLNRARLLV
ncbi:MAG: nucleotidyltransferase family protein [Candidatus Aenigmarchaeota archaeon]|nr:nucleotidyltransferase family protein [Candidatus Aenigmarchaeota archaeon]